ncbi:MAG: hypothetical protein OSA99_13935, partial [Acidimicrobiales bacterium]|nr:hypothetical protein [Acidimicrobiales bacterium]
MGLALLTYELVPFGSTLIARHVDYLTGDEGVNPTVFTIAFGTVGWALHALVVVGSIAWLVRSWPSSKSASPLTVTT